MPILTSAPARRWLLLALLALLALLGLASTLAFRPAWAAYEQSRAARQLNPLLRGSAKDSLAYACLAAPRRDPAEVATLRLALTHLARARQLNPSAAHTYALLGRAHCLLGEYAEAHTAAQEFNRRRPQNPLGRMEQALAGAMLLLSDPALPPAAADRLREQTLADFAALGVSQIAVLWHADAQLQQGRFAAAASLYRLAGLAEPMPYAQFIRQRLLEALPRPPADRLAETFPGVKPMRLREVLVIEPAHWRSLWTFAYFPVREVERWPALMLYHNAEEAFVLLDVRRTGEYCLRLEAFDAPPAPTLLAVRLNWRLLYTAVLYEQDNAWREFTIPLHLKRGGHLLGLKLVNDARVNGVDRNASVSFVRLEACP